MTVIPELLQSLGADPAEVLAEVGLDPELFADPGNVMSLAARGRLLGHCVARTGCKHFGLLIGQTGRLSSLGLLGFLVQHSPDVETALRSLVRFSHLTVRGAGGTLAVQSDFAILGYEIHQPGVAATDQAGDGAMAMFCNILRKLCGPEWTPVEVWFAHRKPEDIGPYRRFFEAPLRFDAERYAIVFSTTWLSHLLPGADPELRRHLREQVDAIEVRHREDFPEQVRSVLRTALIAGHSKADRVAALFSMRSRTLNRRPRRGRRRRRRRSRGLRGEREHLGTVVGAMGGAVVGGRVGAGSSSYLAYQVTVRYDDATYGQIGTAVVSNYRVGSRVQVLGASIEPIVVR